MANTPPRRKSPTQISPSTDAPLAEKVTSERSTTTIPKKPRSVKKGALLTGATVKPVTVTDVGSATLPNNLPVLSSPNSSDPVLPSHPTSTNFKPLKNSKEATNSGLANTKSDLANTKKLKSATPITSLPGSPAAVTNTQPHLPPGIAEGVPTREAILQVLRDADAPLSPLELAEQLNLPVEAQIGFDRRLAAMERDGQLMPNRKGVLLLAKKLDFISGKVTGHRDGFGFLIRDDVGPDIFLTPKEMLKVLHGDRVLIKLTGRDSRGRPEGSIVEVIERRTNRLVGRFLSERGLYLVVPEDQRIKHDILIPPAEIKHAQHGQVVMVEIIEQPTRYAQPLGRIVEVLGEVDDPGMEIEIAVRKFDVPYKFDQAVLDRAEQLPETVQPSDLDGRVDLRDISLVTIDGEDARDFDDAVYCQMTEWIDGKQTIPAWRLLVAIADVSHYVQENDVLDNEAATRSTSVYFPRRVIPMLPEKLSNGLCSLNPHVDRLVLVCDMVIPQQCTKSGQVVAYQFYPAVMHSQARLTYNEVWQALADPEGIVAQRQGERLPLLQDLYALYQLLAIQRKARGAIDFDTVETQIVCNELGRIERIVPRKRNNAHKLIEECMLAANTCAADFLERNKHFGLFRVHEGPNPDKLESLRTFLKSLGMQLGGGDSPAPADYAELLSKIKDRPDAPLLQSMCLRSMKQAVYAPDNAGHFGLAYAAYAHFTSPIRRYPDLLIHRVIKALLLKKRYVPHSNDPHVSSYLSTTETEHTAWEKLGLLCSAHERRADEATRDVEAWLKCWFMKERVGEIFNGAISGVTSFGIFVTLQDLFVEGLVHVSELGSEYFQFNDILHELRGERTGIRFKLTDVVSVQVSRVDLEARRIEFRLVKDGMKSLRYDDVKKILNPVSTSSPGKNARGDKVEKSTKAVASKKQDRAPTNARKTPKRRKKTD